MKTILMENHDVKGQIAVHELAELVTKITISKDAENWLIRELSYHPIDAIAIYKE